MRHVTIYTTDEDFNQFLELANNLHYVKKIETDDEPAKEEVLSQIKKGFEEMRLFMQGNKKGTPIKDFLNEL